MESRELDLAYCAGLIDAEGCISVSSYIADNNRTRFHCDLYVGSQNKECLDFLQKTVGTGTITKRKDIWMFQAFGSKASHVLRLTLQFMIIKRKQAELFIEFAATFEGMKRRATPEELIAKRLELSQSIRSLAKADSNFFHNNGVNSVDLSKETIPSQVE
jgi:hypothetical protein